MKRFLLFRWDQYYPGGGWSDFAGDFDSLEEAQAKDAELQTAERPIGRFVDYAQVIDVSNGQEVWSR